MAYTQIETATARYSAAVITPGVPIPETYLEGSFNGYLIAFDATVRKMQSIS